MQYTIITPQLMLEKYKTLDTSHAAILYFMRQFIGESGVQFHEEDGKRWYWIANNKILSELPLLRISTIRGLRNKLMTLEKTKLIDRKTDGVKTFYHFSEEFFNIYRGKAEVGTNVPPKGEQNDMASGNKSSDNQLTNINIPKSNIYIDECFDRFWSSYPATKEAQKQKCKSFFIKSQLHAKTPEILKAISNYKKLTKVKNGYVYNPTTFLKDIYPSYVKGVPKDEQDSEYMAQNFRDEGAELIEKIEWLDETLSEMSVENVKLIKATDGQVIVTEKGDLFTPKEIEIIKSFGGIEELIESYTTQLAKEKLTRIIQK